MAIIIRQPKTWIHVTDTGRIVKKAFSLKWAEMFRFWA